ncbi:hypothetical protein J6590_078153 [Homalodisca vitripennis]|nr:hypothetical protein J6590_078153 [Homalodisca vitripennis]
MEGYVMQCFSDCISRVHRTSASLLIMGITSFLKWHNCWVICLEVSGNLWGLDGINVYTKSVPYPNKTSLDISDQLVAQNYTGLKMAKTAEQFYVSINMSAMTEKFWKYSIFERPATGNIDCSPSGYRFFDGEDYRIRICTSPTMDFLGRVHHEMAHIENYMAWKDLPWLFQDASNPGVP